MLLGLGSLADHDTLRPEVAFDCVEDGRLSPLTVTKPLTGVGLPAMREYAVRAEAPCAPVLPGAPDGPGEPAGPGVPLVPATPLATTDALDQLNPVVALVAESVIRTSAAQSV